MCIVTDRSKQVLSTPKKEYLEKVRRYLLSYRGRMAITLKNLPRVTILTRVSFSYEIKEDECVVIMVEVDKNKPLLSVLFYLEDIRNYYIFGVNDMVHKVSKSETGNDCPSSVRLLD